MEYCPIGLSVIAEVIHVILPHVEVYFLMRKTSETQMKVKVSKMDLTFNGTLVRAIRTRKWLFSSVNPESED